MEVFLPFPAESRALVPPMTHAKGTWLASSVLQLRQHGHLDAYLKLLDPSLHDVLLHAVTTEWYPVDVLVAHYTACDRLNLSNDEIIAVAEHVSARAQGGVLELAARLAESTGVTPWVAMAQLNRLWVRVAKGGGLGVYKLGPKEARVEVIQFPASRLPYCQIAMRGILQGVLGLFCHRVFARLVPSLTSPTQIAALVSWA